MSDFLEKIAAKAKKVRERKAKEAEERPYKLFEKFCNKAAEQGKYGFAVMTEDKELLDLMKKASIKYGAYASNKVFSDCRVFSWRDVQKDVDSVKSAYVTDRYSSAQERIDLGHKLNVELADMFYLARINEEGGSDV